MSPQFVDFDADGRLDIVAGTFDGSPHVARGSAEGWRAPEQILDASGARIVTCQVPSRRCASSIGTPTGSPIFS